MDLLYFCCRLPNGLCLNCSRQRRVTKSAYALPVRRQWCKRKAPGDCYTACCGQEMQKHTTGDCLRNTSIARFSANPKASHAEAVKHIGRYLVGNKDEGIILDTKELIGRVCGIQKLSRTTRGRQSLARDTSFDTRVARSHGQATFRQKSR
jgi:hypothetical protein